jgi:putative oxidoreductase
MPLLATWSPRMLSVLRIIVGLLFIEHGLMKMFHFPGPQPGVPSPLTALLMTAAWIEIIAGGLVTQGLFTRIAAFVCSGEMAVAYFLFHVRMGRSIFPVMNQGGEAVLYCFIFLFIAAAGAGPWSIDAMLGRKKTSP